MIKKINRTCLFLCLLPVITFAVRNVPLDYSDFESKLLTHSGNLVDLQQICDTPVTYKTLGIWNLEYSSIEVARVAMDFVKYPQIFRYVFRSDRVLDRLRTSPLGTWYVEGRAARARVWAIGNIDSIIWRDSSHLRLIASQNENPRLEYKWSYKQKGWLNYRTHGVKLAAFIIPTSNNSCRVGIVAQGWVKKKMPEWLVRMATNIILPRLMQDLEKEVKRRSIINKPPQKTWYKRWYKNVKD